MPTQGLLLCFRRSPLGQEQGTNDIYGHTGRAGGTSSLLECAPGHSGLDLRQAHDTSQAAQCLSPGGLELGCGHPWQA